MESQAHTLLTLLLLLPVVAACLAWGRRGAWSAVPAAGLLAAMRLSGWGAAPPTVAGFGADLAAAAAFAAVGLITGGLRERGDTARRALRQAEEKHRLLLEEILTGVVILRDGRILLANRRFTDMVGVGAEELAGRELLTLMHPEDRRRLEDLVRTALADDARSPDWEGRLIRRSGRPVWVQLSVCPSSHDGQPAMLLNVWDITCQKLAEEQRRQLSDLARRQEEQLEHSTRLAELGEMAAAISHEINQPLTGIRNYARNAFYMLEKNVGSLDEVKENLRLISDQVDRASRIISQMRELARRSERSFSALDVNGVIRESVEFLMPQMKMSGVTVRLDLAADLPEVLGDRVRLGQVFLNLLTNARQAMEDAPERRLVVRSYTEVGSSQSIIVEVADTGKGFSPEEARKLFVPFFTTKKSGQGTGLGLSISQSIIKDHQGMLEAYGSAGEGATFRIRLPAVVRETARAAGA